MSRTNRDRLRSGIVSTLGLAMVCIGGWFYARSSDALKLSALDAEIDRIEKVAAKGNAPAAKASLAAIVESSPVTWFAKPDETARKDRARIALARILDRERETPRAARLLADVSTASAKADAEYLLGRFEARKRLAEADNLASRGAWAEAEKIYSADIDFGADSLPHRLLYHKLLVRQGRTTEAREVYAGGIFAVEKPQDVLLSLWIMDTEEPRVAEWEADVAAARSLSPDDLRVRLAQVFLARSAGRFDEAFEILSGCFSKRAESSDSNNAKLQAEPERYAALLLGLDSPAHFRKCMQLAFPDQSKSSLNLSKPDATKALARICRVLGLAEAEKNWLGKLLDLSPTDRSALSRLSEIARATGQTAVAADFERRKSESETLRIDYTRLARKAADPSQSDAAKLAESADRLGLKFDAWAWGRIARRQPIDPGTAPPPEMLSIERNAPPEFWQSFSDSDSNKKSDVPDEPDLQAQHLKFVDIAENSGLARFTHLSVGSSAQLTPPVSSSGGVAIFDFDNDGHQDVYAVQSGTFPPDPAKPNDGDKLFRNRGDGTFDDVTAKAGIDKFPRGFGHGVTIGDVDNDGHSDIFVTRWRTYALYRNRGDGTFEDVTAKFGLDGDRDWPTSAAFADLDNDGDLDLYVCHYLEWIEGKAYPCIDPSKPNTYDCRPLDFPAMQDRIYRNDGGRFQDVSTESGISAIDSNGRGFGVVAVDVNEDGLVDLFVANDTSPNFLLINKGGLKFEDEALVSGVAANAQGGFQAGMGVAAADVTGDGLVDLAVTNYFNESTTIFVNLGNGLFADRSAVLGVAAPSRFLLGFGILLTDFDNDGLMDYMTANGHVTDGRPAIPWRMPMQVLRGTAAKLSSKSSGNRNASEEIRFVDDSPKAGELFSRQLMARGLASGDLDGDGLADVVAQSQNDALIHAKNESLADVPKERHPHWIGLDLKGTRSNRDAVGAVVTAKIRGKSGHTIERKFWRTGGGSFQSASSNRILIGLGYDSDGIPHAAIESIKIRWPSGKEDFIGNPANDVVHEIKESP